MERSANRKRKKIASPPWLLNVNDPLPLPSRRETRRRKKKKKKETTNVSNRLRRGYQTRTRFAFLGCVMQNGGGDSYLNRCEASFKRLNLISAPVVARLLLSSRLSSARRVPTQRAASALRRRE